jgi:hypothetical protein
MITEIVLWKMPDGMSREEILSKFRSTVPAWQGNPNLIHKAFVFDESSRRRRGVPLEGHRRCQTGARTGLPRPHQIRVWRLQYFDAPVVIDNAAKQVIDNSA